MVNSRMEEKPKLKKKEEFPCLMKYCGDNKKIKAVVLFQNENRGTVVFSNNTEFYLIGDYFEDFEINDFELLDTKEVIIISNDEY